MIKVGTDDITKQHALYVESYRNGSSVPLLYESYTGKTLKTLADSVEYPMDIKLPKALSDMLYNKDSTPARILRIERQPVRRRISKDGEPTDEFIPVWFGSTANGVNLRFGYKNGDSRYLSTHALYDRSVHAFLGGATGQGKSVTLNNLIFNMCEEYPPWELELVLIDPKIVEFKAYALTSPLPHIRTIGATSDSDYVISALAALRDEMDSRSKLFALFGTKNIKEFRKATGLAIPRNVIVMDEVQTTFKNAGKRSRELIALLDDFARLGRSSGYHLLMASQEVGSDIPSDTLANIQIRGALGCTAPVSEKIIGNDEASIYYGKAPGNMLVNTNASQGQKADNTLYKVPYLSTEVQISVSKEEMRLSKEVNFRNPLNFYDEEDLITFSRYPGYLEKFPCNPNRVYLGEPSFVTKSLDKVLYLEFTSKELENILCMSYNSKNSLRTFLMLKENLLRYKGSYLHNVLCADSSFEETGNASELANSNNFYTDKTYLNNNFFSITESVIRRRKMLIKIDSSVFADPKTHELTDELFYKLVEHGSELDTKTNRSRCFYLFALLSENEEYQAMFNPQKRSPGSEEFTDLFTKLLNILLQMYKCYGCLDKMLTVSCLPAIFNWILGIDKVIGLGRDTKQRYIETLKKCMFDASTVNVRYVIFTRDLSEIRELVKATRWALFEELISGDQRAILGDSNYPPVHNNRLAMVVDMTQKSDNMCLKYKKTLFDDEIV